MKRFEELVHIVKKLRAPDGCPWDREQNLYSIKEQMLEEAYELAHALDSKDVPNIQEELGDLALHVVFHSVMAEEDGLFTVEDVLEGINDKLVRRHPHVFGDTQVDDSDHVVRNWEAIKASEKGVKAEKPLLSKVHRYLPTLPRARKLQEKAASVGFDWDSVPPCMEKVQEEMEEFQQAVASGDKDAIRHELGDILFALINVSRHLGVDPDEALRMTNNRFENRFGHVEKRIKESGRELKEASLDEMEELWQEAKKQEKQA